MKNDLSLPFPSFLPLPTGYSLLTLDEIINGQEGGFPGLIHIIQVFLDTTCMGNDVRDVVEQVYR